MNKFNIAVVQMRSTESKEDNLKKIEKFILEAVEKKADLISFPENVNYSGNDFESEELDGKTYQLFSRLASEKKVYIHGGSISEENGTKRPYNTTMFFDRKGNMISKYRKLHMFDVDISDGPAYRESDSKTPGNEIVTVDTDLCKMGLSICYDIRFPELYRILALNGAKVIFTPANFVMNTGKDHWESILRARAIENTVYIVAAGQTGQQPEYIAYGKSLIIDPWGDVIAKSSDKEGVIVAEIDLDYLDKVRSQVPSLNNRRGDVYELKVKNS
ncbi:carbon-nitrogen hydrolase family protein [Anaerosphaera multitolerans]|uniref:Carbon-nitrogen hydrolase family protein n=1 Tax=Anaerosphaera multitolerans TaxID=2487351 RepID=A0A437S5J2_9FIRM|nr:carbon-nitrogen hydrolase family protein [Anaerosphaera multitolerans]RVU54280.1 carbon-nitrogen hydrolase family protein [Anaerosphaera multitolerans]